MKKILSTERLHVREVMLSDAKIIFELMNTKGWLENIGDRGIRTIEDAEKYIREKYFTSYEKYGYGGFLMERKADQKILGMCGLFRRPELEHADIGFALLPEYFGKGYAYEASSQLLEYAISNLGMKTIGGITTFENKSSQKLLEKLGLKYKQPIDFEGEALMYYSN